MAEQDHVPRALLVGLKGFPSASMSLIKLPYLLEVKGRDILESRQFNPKAFMVSLHYEAPAIPAGEIMAELKEGNAFGPGNKTFKAD